MVHQTQSSQPSRAANGTMKLAATSRASSTTRTNRPLLDIHPPYQRGFERDACLPARIAKFRSSTTWHLLSTPRSGRGYRGHDEMNTATSASGGPIESVADGAVPALFGAGLAFAISAPR